MANSMQDGDDKGALTVDYSVGAKGESSRREYHAPKLRPLGRVAELVRGSSNVSGDATLGKKHT